MDHVNLIDMIRIKLSRAQVVGWPPVRSSRKNIYIQSQQQKNKQEEEAEVGGAFVKVSMDGAPYLRKVDLKQYKSYHELSEGLAKMFSSFTNNTYGPPQATKDFLNESKLIDLLSCSDYVPTYEDKDSDWMLVGDVPWEYAYVPLLPSIPSLVCVCVSLHVLLLTLY